MATVVIVVAIARYRAPQPEPADEARSESPAPPASTASYQVAARPLPSVQESATHAWTAEDARRIDVIERIAHHPLEVERMIEENDRILRRQLVYRHDPAGMVVQRSKASGEPIRQLVLPGLDGRELVFDIDRADLSPSGQAGSFQGHLAGRPDSIVTLAFKFGREAFSVSSPQDGLYLEAEPREPGQLVIKEIDPETYIALPCGTPDFIAYEQFNLQGHTHE